ncbi:hypothetical protein [Paenibacillus sp. MBLB4367]|uniref:hypothetical protein n=1 Tax=Paenibacillus sp. MBLB4367 TaxID=3384767 RepID=UPI0039083D93
MENQSTEQRDIFLDKFLKILRYKNRKNYMQKKDAVNIINRFLEKKTVSTENFEAILLTIDDTTRFGSIEVLKGNDPKAASNWRDIIALVAKDYVPPMQIRSHLDDVALLTEITFLFHNMIEFCSHPDRETFVTRLYDFNRFLQMKKDG